MSDLNLEQLESDPRFPSGKWAGFFIQDYPPKGRHQTEMVLTFTDGKISGEGRDFVGEYVMDGTDEVDSGKCFWVKQYVGRHQIHYQGFNEGKGIWGTWEIQGHGLSGGFHIWPEGMANSHDTILVEEAEPPVEVLDEELIPAGPPDDVPGDAPAKKPPFDPF